MDFPTPTDRDFDEPRDPDPPCHFGRPKVQPAQPPLRMSSAFPNVGDAVEDTQGSGMMERRLQRKIEWTELPAVLAEGLLRLHGAGVELAESVFSSDDTGTFTPLVRVRALGVPPKGSMGAACVCWACLKNGRGSVLEKVNCHFWSNRDRDRGL